MASIRSAIRLASPGDNPTSRAVSSRDGAGPVITTRSRGRPRPVGGPAQAPHDVDRSGGAHRTPQATEHPGHSVRPDRSEPRSGRRSASRMRRGWRRRLHRQRGRRPAQRGRGRWHSELAREPSPGSREEVRSTPSRRSRSDPRRRRRDASTSGRLGSTVRRGCWRG